MKDDDQKNTDEELRRLDDELQELIDEEDDQEITDEELQRLIDINEADSAEPGGISPQRREKLLKDTENRIISLSDVFKPGDIIIVFFEERRAALLRGDSAEEIDALTVEYAEQNEIDLDVFDEDWIGTERLKLKQISRIEDEVEQDAALEALAVESILKEDRQKAVLPVREFTEEWFNAQRSCWPTWRWRLKHPFRFFYRYVFIEESSRCDTWWEEFPRFALQALFYILVMGTLAAILLALEFAWNNWF